MTALYLLLIAVCCGCLADLFQFALGSPKTGVVVPGRILSWLGSWACLKYDEFDNATERKRLLMSEERRRIYDRANPWKLIVCPYCNAPHFYTVAAVLFVALSGVSWWWLLTLPLGWGVTYGTLVALAK